LSEIKKKKGPAVFGGHKVEKERTGLFVSKGLSVTRLKKEEPSYKKKSR